MKRYYEDDDPRRKRSPLFVQKIERLNAIIKFSNLPPLSLLLPPLRLCVFSSNYKVDT